ncbi:MAG: NUDIX domain-containing protein [Bacteriovoracaceae bacterium]|jgi:8-oxo-dGTP pyrophosphatase MutT (NUDIX family)|nr:NUDIX domain-containing protein [Bacteriovoracaceae bacterium]
MFNHLKIPKKLTQLSNIIGEDYPLDKWSGAVLFLVVEEKLVFIKRSETMPTHRGQIGFMGGHKLSDESNPFETAYREFEEESSISRSFISCEGLLTPVLTSKGQLIIPVLSYFSGSEELFLKKVKSNGEWDNLILVPVVDLSDMNSWSMAKIYGNREYDLFFFPLIQKRFKFLAKSSENFLLWGASAKMVLNFFQNYLYDDKTQKIIIKS